MINNIRKNGKVFLRRSKKLTSGEIECKKCGEWEEVKKLTSSHFNEEFLCKECKKELKKYQAKVEKLKQETQKPKSKLSMPDNCSHKNFLWCKNASNCVGCIYHPIKEIALMKRHEDEEEKDESMWFYYDEEDARERLKILDDIRLGKGLFKNGRRSNFRFSQRNVDKDEE